MIILPLMTENFFPFLLMDVNAYFLSSKRDLVKAERITLIPTCIPYALQLLSCRAASVRFARRSHLIYVNESRSYYCEMTGLLVSFLEYKQGTCLGQASLYCIAL